MKEYNISAQPLSFLSIQEIWIEEEINEHGKMRIEGYIEDDEEEKYLALLTGNVWEKVEKIGKTGEREILFWGIITDFSIDSQYHQKKMVLEITTGSSLMDQKEHLRSYQNSCKTYQQIFSELIAEYKESSVSINSSLTDVEEKLILQYCETDWQFLRRLSSRKNRFLIADSHNRGIRLNYDLPTGSKFEFPECGKYTMIKELDTYRRKKSNGLTHLGETDSLLYIVQCREGHRLGDYMILHGKKFFVYKIQSRLSGGEMLHDCYLKSKHGMDVPKSQQEQMAGNSLDAMIVGVKEDKVQVKILGDENIQQDINIWYPYATAYSTPDGTGWYCMPELGDMVRLTIPGREEKEAFVTSSVHMEIDSADRKDPSVRSFKSRYQKEVRFTPDSIVITNNQGTKIELTDAEGIHMISAHSVMLEAAEDMTVSSDTGSLIIAGTSSVNLSQGGTTINLDKGITFTGGELKIQ